MSNPIRKDHSVDVIRLIDKLKEELGGYRSYFGVTFGLNCDDVVMQLEKIQAHLPTQMREAANLARESERILHDATTDAEEKLASAKRDSEQMLKEAHAEAERIVEQARLQQESLISESEVLKLAKAQAEDIRNTSERESRQMRREADKYAHEVLTSVEGTLSRMLTQVERGKNELDQATRRENGENRDKAPAPK